MNPDTAVRATTSDVDASLRYDAWGGMLQDVYGSWNLGPAPRPDFRGALTRRSTGGLQVVDCSCDPHSGIRRRADVKRDGAESLTLQLVVEGQETFTINENTVRLGQGDVLVWTSLLPMRFEVTHRLRKISVTMPLSRVRSWFPGTWDTLDNLLPASAPGVGLLGSFVGLLSGSVLSDPSSDGEALTESMLGVLRNVVRPEVHPVSTGLGDAQRARALDYIDRRLADPTLTPAGIAAACKISVRYLHQLFENRGQTVLEHIVSERLRRCCRDLQNPAMADRTITEIAFSWGFQDSSHFSRRFKARYGTSPREGRASSRMPGLTHSGSR